ncbi:MAG: hypothetical protein LC799_19085 [Actinobacteria bacterium]|nr:hypothetical protein [Actinomycetota bacterium]
MPVGRPAQRLAIIDVALIIQAWQATAEVRCAAAVSRATHSTQLAASLRRVHAELREIWPRMATVCEPGAARG